MVFQFLGTILGGLESAGVSAATNPIMEWINQELSKIIPVKKAQVRSLILLWYHKEIDDITFYERMARYGYDKLESDREIKAAEFFPSVNDNIRLAVREADRDDIAKLFGTDDEFNKLPIAEFFKSGITEEQLKRYWRAHWELPSTQQVFEMLHRLSPQQIPFKKEDLKAIGITEDDAVTNLQTVQTYLKTADVMKYWRPRLSMISYNPITRIDIRRFEDFGIIDDEQLEFLNREIGYSPASAKLLSLWTRLANALNDIVPLLKDGSLSYDEATKLLVAEGASLETAKKLIDRKKHFIKSAKLKPEKDLMKQDIREAYEVGLLTRDEAKRQYKALNYDDDEAEFLLKLSDAKLGLTTKKTLSKEKNLTKVDILNSYKQRLTGRPDAKTQLQSIGYDSKEAETLLAIEDAKAAAKGAKKT